MTPIFRTLPRCGAVIALCAPLHALAQDDVDLSVTGYAQAQYATSETSEDEVDPEGGALNQDRFLLRRGRVKLSAAWRFVRTDLEVDLNTVDGPYVSPSLAQVGAFWPNDKAAVPYVGLTAGLTDIPFGSELPRGSRDRLFLERSFGSRALFPGERDVGATLSGGLGPVRYAAAIQNGTPLKNTPGDQGDVFTAEKTWLGRLGLAGGSERLDVSGGVSFLSGTALHAGTPASKSTLLWSDSNENGSVSLDELVGVNGQAASASETFETWAVNADLHAGLKTRLGWTHVYAEATMASNLDRGYLIADPVSTGHDVRELAWSVAATQEVFTYGLVAFRADSYDPDSDAFEARRGDFYPVDLSVLTLAPAVGVQVPGVARLIVQYDYIVDHLGRDALGEPIDLPNDQWTVRAQVEF